MNSDEMLAEVDELYSALIRDDGGAKYEEIRERLIEEHGYDTFFNIQSKAFRRICREGL